MAADVTLVSADLRALLNDYEGAAADDDGQPPCTEPRTTCGAGWTPTGAGA